MPITKHNKQRVRDALSGALDLLDASRPYTGPRAETVNGIRKAIQIVDQIEVRDKPLHVEEFSLGQITAEHVVGPYSIIEYRSKMSDETLFHAYYEDDGKMRDTHESFYSLDAAIIGAVAHKHAQRGAIMYIARMLGLKWD